MTNADNGKVLGVVNGAWDKADVAGRVSYPEYSYDEENSEWVCNFTFQEIVNRIQTGRTVIAQLRIGEELGENTNALIPISGVIASGEDIVAVVFSQAAPSNYADFKQLTSVFIGHTAGGITVDYGEGYLSESDPNA